ncbi:Uncharacterised protein [Mycobacteroides abscessus subsp. abscessus]|nr:Uncharacterised protein [Mycobacteroides abscessus subsp. abscessus]
MHRTASSGQLHCEATSADSVGPSNSPTIGGCSPRATDITSATPARLRSSVATVSTSTVRIERITSNGSSWLPSTDAVTWPGRMERRCTWRSRKYRRALLIRRLSADSVTEPERCVPVASAMSVRPSTTSTKARDQRVTA